MLLPQEEALACAHSAVEETKVQGECGSDRAGQPCRVKSNPGSQGGPPPPAGGSPRSACFQGLHLLLLSQEVFLVSQSPFPVSAVGCHSA